jgi:hypothetical protein
VESGATMPSVIVLRRMSQVLHVAVDIMLDTALGDAAPPEERLVLPEIENGRDVSQESRYVKRLIRRARGLEPSSLRLLTRLTQLLNKASERRELDPVQDAAARAEASRVIAALEDAGIISSEGARGPLKAALEHGDFGDEDLEDHGDEDLGDENEEDLGGEQGEREEREEQEEKTRR